MNAAEFRAAILEAIQEVAPEADLSRLADIDEFRDELDLDSMDLLNVMIGIHKRTGVDVPERDYPRLSTLRGAIDYLLRRAGGSGAQPR